MNSICGEKTKRERERIWTMSIGHLLIIDINSDAFKYCQLCEYTALSVWLHQRVIKNELNPLTPITIGLSTTCGGDGDGGRGRPQNRIQTHAHYAEEFKCARIYSQTIDCFFSTTNSHLISWIHLVDVWCVNASNLIKNGRIEFSFGFWIALNSLIEYGCKRFCAILVSSTMSDWSLFLWIEVFYDQTW